VIGETLVQEKYKLESKDIETSWVIMSSRVRIETEEQGEEGGSCAYFFVSVRVRGQKV